jgi:tetratricopeptide (TPR) repeat protein
MSDRFLNRTSSRTIVLLGMGGSGKTQLALEFCRQAEESLGFMAIIWIDASSPASVAQSYKIIAKNISKDRQDDVESDATISLVHNVLRGWKQWWLVVFDNYNSPKAFQSQGIRHYIPSGNNGCILFTSRHADSTRLGHSIAVSGMNDSESLSLLLQRVPLNEEEKIHGREIASALGNLALALDQAGAYIRARNLKLKDFIPHYNKRKEVILREIPDEWEYRRVLKDAERETSLSVFTTWELSFEQISGNSEEKERKDHFLTLAAFFDNKNISERYFQAHFNLDRPGWMDMFSTEGKWDSYKLGDVLAELRKLSLLQTSGQQTNELRFSLHPVIRDWIRLRKNRCLQQQFAAESITALTNYLQIIDNDEISLEIQQEIALHIDACVQNGKELLEGLPYFSLSYIPNKASWFADFYRHQGRYDEAEELYKRTLTSREEKLGPTHPDTLGTVQNLATVLADKGRYDEAEKLYKRALAGKEEKLGTIHPGTLRTVQNLANVLADRGRYDEAEKLYKRALAGREEKLGPTHPRTLQTVQNLVMCLEHQGRSREAKSLRDRFS